MGVPLRALVLEDSQADAELVVAELRRAGFDADWVRVQTEREYLAELDSMPEIILSDWAMPQFDAGRALQLLKERGLDVPFIIVSGTIGEDVAVEAMRQGAADYLLKDRLARLGQAVSHSLEQKRAEQRLRLQAAALESAANAIVITDRDGRITWVNPAFTRLTGYTAEEAIGQNPRLLRSGEQDQAFYRDLWETVLAGEVWHGELVNRRKDGSLYVDEQTITPVRDGRGELSHFIAIKQDITERKRDEEEIRGLNADLEHRVVERTANLREATEALRKAKEEAERANRAKDEFLSRMSHELRTPLNAVLGFAQLLEMEGLPPEQHDSVRQIRAGGQHLLELIDEVLDISRIATGALSLSLEPVGVSETLRDVVGLVQPLAAERGITLRLEDPNGLYVLADRQRLKQVVLNLLSNAIKYNREGGKVDVSWAKALEGRLRIQVGDTGPGIPADRLERMFVPFDRLGAEGSGVEGTGLGLSLSKTLVGAMGGTLEAKSEVGAGSVFTVELLLAEPPDQRYERERHEHDRIEELGQARSVLYVEDNLSNLRLVERILDRRPGVHLLTAMQGRLGIDLAREHQPDLILLDLHLPDIGGEEALRRLREDPATAGIPVVVLSADATSAQIKTLLAAGARDYLTKPIDVKRFLEVVDNLLRGSEDG